MNLYLITFQSALNRIESVYDCHKDLFVEIEKFFTLHLVSYTEAASIPADAYRMAFIASGGVEKIVTQHFELLPYPIHLLTDGQQNSLAASLEIATWIRSKGMKIHIIHGTIPNMVKQLIDHHKAFAAQRELKGKRIGVVGYSSPWLVASNVDYLLAKRRWGIEYTDVSLDRIYEYYGQITDDEVGEACAGLAGKALACREASPEDMIKAMRLYRAIKRIVEEERLSAITLSCFRLIDQTGTTGCLALALLNDEGIIAGCEGDLQSVFTMLAVKVLTGKNSFMANPSMINARTNEIILAHCTIGIAQTEQFIIRNHFETESGIGIQGILPTGDVTIVKCGSESLDEYYLSTGTLVENTNYINMCRTQVRIKMNSPADYFLKTPLGNHHIMLYGNYEDILEEFLQANACKRIE